jgi:hypothetical protein
MKWNEELTDDWKKGNKVHKTFSAMAESQIDTFGLSILKRFGFKQVSINTHTLAPGVVYTEAPYAQAAHLDFDETEQTSDKKSWILHMPLQRDGLLLSVWDPPVKNTQDEYIGTHEHIYVPFGAYIALRSDVLHSGVLGAPGNVRFHMILKSRNSIQVVDKDKGQEHLHYLTGEGISVKERPPWSGSFDEGRKKFKVYEKEYIRRLEQHTGMDLGFLLKCLEFKKGSGRNK